MFSSNNSQVSNDAVFVEDVFSTWLYAGNGSTQTITNGIDLAGKGGLVWFKSRPINNHCWIDSARGAGFRLFSDQTVAQDAAGNISFLSSGFSLNNSNGLNNASSTNYASWTFRKQPKFFDVVTFTSNGSNAQQISHSLGSVPGCIILKRTDNTGNWIVWHRGNGSTDHYTFSLNNTSAALSSGSTFVSSGKISSTIFSPSYLDDHLGNYPVSGGTYVAYLFAHNAGGFGLTGTDNVISCGSYTGNGSATGPVVTLGYEPQWLMIKRSAGGVEDWVIIDNMRGMVNGDSGSNEAILIANGTNAEVQVNRLSPIATGFQLTDTGAAVNASGSTYIYIAIRRGPMKVPTTGTSVLGLNARSGTSANATVTGGAGVTDLAIIKRRNGTANWVWAPRLAGTGYLSSNATTAETAAGTTILQANPWDVMDGVKVGTTSTLTNASGSTFINYLIDRAPGFMDVVCYTGTGANLTLAHNLTVKPELALFKRRSGVDSWVEFHDMNASTYSYTFFTAGAAATQPYGAGYRLQAQPSATSLYLNDYGSVNTSGATYVAYLFATLPGVSKVGSYTGNGSTQTINCGFTGGARFVLIKNTSATENWQIFDTARGMVAGTDPELRPNTTDAEANVSNMVYTAATGFELVTSNAVVNGTGNNYIFLAIA